MWPEHLGRVVFEPLVPAGFAGGVWAGFACGTLLPNPVPLDYSVDQAELSLGRSFGGLAAVLGLDTFQQLAKSQRIVDCSFDLMGQVAARVTCSGGICCNSSVELAFTTGMNTHGLLETDTTCGSDGDDAAGSSSSQVVPPSGL